MGAELGFRDGDADDAGGFVATVLGFGDGILDGSGLGLPEETTVGVTDGERAGAFVGAMVDGVLGSKDGDKEGAAVGPTAPLPTGSAHLFREFDHTCCTTYLHIGRNVTHKC